NFLTRTSKEVNPLKENIHLEPMQEGAGGGLFSTALTEIQYDNTERKADTYQYNVMYQMYSPEIMFGNVSLNNSTRFNIIGGNINNYNAYWGQERRIVSKIIDIEGKTFNKITPHASGGSEQSINGNINFLMDRGLISDT